MLHFTRLALVVMTAAAAAPAAPQGAPEASPIAAGLLRVFDAEYGDQASQRLCDATRVVRALCDGHASCVVPVGNALCGDPAFGTPKKLHMAFKCEGGVPLLIVSPEPSTIQIACPQAPSPGAPSPGAPSPGAPSPGAPSPGATGPGASDPGAGTPSGRRT